MVENLRKKLEALDHNKDSGKSQSHSLGQETEHQYAGAPETGQSLQQKISTKTEPGQEPVLGITVPKSWKEEDQYPGKGAGTWVAIKDLSDPGKREIFAEPNVIQQNYN